MTLRRQPMRSKTLSASVAVMFMALSAINMRAQSGANTVAAQVAAAKAAADDSWLILYSELCGAALGGGGRSEEHTSEVQSRFDLVCRLLLEKKKDEDCRVPF